MARTNVERVDESVAYIKKNIGADLAEKFKGINKEQAVVQKAVGYRLEGTARLNALGGVGLGRRCEAPLGCSQARRRWKS